MVRTARLTKWSPGVLAEHGTKKLLGVFVEIVLAFSRRNFDNSAPA